MNMERKLITTVLTIICFTLRDSLDPVDRATFIDIVRLSAQPNTIP